MLVWLRSSCIYGSSKAPVFTEAMWDVWECEEAAPRNLVLQCVAMEQEMCIHYGHGLESRAFQEVSQIFFSPGWGRAKSGGSRCLGVGAWVFGVLGGCSQVSVALVGSGRAWGMPQGTIT